MGDNTIKCETCGRFIGYNQLAKGGGASIAFIPESDVSFEELKYRCKSCTDSLGKVRTSQFGHIESNSWVL